MITGKPGIGKSDLTDASRIEAGADMHIFHPVVSDPTDFKGLPYAGNGGEACFLPFSDLNRLINATSPLVAFFDDLGQAPASVQAACMQLFLSRKLNGFQISDHVTFLAATNRKQDKAGVTGILEPVKSRFVSIVELEVSTDDWVRWAITKGNMPVELISFIRFRPELLDNFQPTRDITNSPSPRTVANVGKMERANLPAELRREAVKGAAGEAFATEYLAFLDIFKELPNIDRILLNPDKEKVPSEPAALFAVSGALAGKVNEVNADNAFRYINRMPVENATACVKDMTIRKPEIANTKPFALWAADNGNEIFN